MPGPSRPPVVVIGLGNEFRHDDGVGLAVAGRLRGLVPPGVELVITDGEPTRLIEAWTGAALAVVVDADLTQGTGLTPAVAAAVDPVAAAILDDIGPLPTVT